jgi:hypothetical protein
LNEARRFLVYADGVNILSKNTIFLKEKTEVLLLLALRILFLEVSLGLYLCLVSKI